MMLTFRAGKVAALAACLSVAACSREQQDWRSAEAADTVESYGQVLERHPDSELVAAARTRVAQLAEDREWQQAGSADTADSYRQFLAHHPNGRWAQEARIRIQNFALNGLAAPGPAGIGPVGAAPAAGASTTAAPATSTLAAPGASTTAARPASTTAVPAAGTSVAAPVATPGELAAPASSASPAARPVSTGAPVDVPTATATTGYGIQLGAFASETAANAAWQQLSVRFGAQLAGLSPRVVAANTPNGTLFRLQAGVSDEARARALCDMLRKGSQACVPVLPH